MMFNPLPLLPLLNGSLSSTLDCWQQHPAKEMQLPPIIYKECREIIAQIHVGEKSLAPLVFSRSSSAGFKVPESWQHGSCVVTIDVKGNDAHETSTFAEITKRAFSLMVECVIKEPHLGGRSFVGDHDGLEVLLFGLEPGRESYCVLLVRILTVKGTVRES
jgi:hypothetical protein